MEETLIYVDKQETVTETCEKVKAARTGSVVLVVPAHSILTQSLVNLKIVQAIARENDKELTLVSTDQDARNLAAQSGMYALEFLPGHNPDKLGEKLESLPPMQSQVQINYRHTVQAPTRPHIPAIPKTEVFVEALNKLKPTKRNLITGTSLVLVAFILGMIFLPQTQIALAVSAKPYNVALPLRMADLEASRQPEGEILGGRFIDTLQEITKTFPATGSRNEGGKARGEILVTNRSQALIGLKADTRFAAGALIFRVPSEVLVPAASSSKPGEARALVVAEEGGEAGNLKAGAKLTVPGLTGGLREVLSAAAISDFTGGTDKKIGIISESDILDAQKSISESLRTDSSKRLKRQIKKGETIYPELVQIDIIDATPSEKPGDESESFELKVKLRSWTIVVAEGSLDEVAKQAVTTQFGSKYVMTEETAEKVFPVITSTDFMKRAINFDLKISGQVYEDLNIKTLSSKLRFTTNKTARERILANQQVKEVEIAKLPSWMPWLPPMGYQYKWDLTFKVG